MRYILLLKLDSETVGYSGYISGCVAMVTRLAWGNWQCLGFIIARCTELKNAGATKVSTSVLATPQQSVSVDLGSHTRIQEADVFMPQNAQPSQLHE